MKTKGNRKKNLSTENDKFDRRSTKSSSSHKDRSSKRRLSIYDDFNEDDDFDLDYDEDDV